VADKATFAAGNFWGVEEAFRLVDGVVSTMAGYTGGNSEHPTYQEVCSGHSGHALAVEVLFDPTQVSYERLLEIFWECHDPTSLNRQGSDVGSHYRSAIYYHTEAQRGAAFASKQRLEATHRHRRPVVTHIEPASAFYRAEEFHQRYIERRGRFSTHTWKGLPHRGPTGSAEKL
jgi:peptide-methionine (S)-S-oxide reductase